MLLLCVDGSHSWPPCFKRGFAQGSCPNLAAQYAFNQDLYSPISVPARRCQVPALARPHAKFLLGRRAATVDFGK